MATLALPSGQQRCIAAHSGPVTCARWNGNGKYAITGGHDRAVRLWNPRRDDPTDDTVGALLVQQYKGPHGHPISDALLSHDDLRLATCGGDKTVFLWDVAEARTVRKFNGHNHRVNSVAFNAESTVLVSGSYDGSVRCWDCRSYNSAPIQVLDVFKDSVTKVLCTPGEIIACSVDGTVRVFDLRVGKAFCDNLHDAAGSVAVSNDGNCLLVSCLSGGGTLKLLEKGTGDLLTSYTGHVNKSYNIGACFSSTDAHVCSGGEDGIITCWELVEATKVRTLEGHRKAVSSVAYHPKEHMLLSASHDGTARVWA